MPQEKKSAVFAVFFRRQGLIFRRNARILFSFQQKQTHTRGAGAAFFMKSVPKRMNLSGNSSALRGAFFADRHKSSRPDFFPRYMAVANDITKRIFDGEYRPGTRLPSMRILARKYGVSVQVILSALQGLQALNYLRAEPKKGVFVSPDICSGRFYRIGVFVLHENPFDYGGILYDLNNALTRAGYTMIIGMNFDGGLSLKQWVSHKHNLDALLVFGVPAAKEIHHFKRIRVPYLLMGAEPAPEVTEKNIKRMNVFLDWFLNTLLDAGEQARPLFLYDAPEDAGCPADGGAWRDYRPGKVYGFTRKKDGSLAVRSLPVPADFPEA